MSQFLVLTAMGDDEFTGTHVDEDDPYGTGHPEPDHELESDEESPVGKAGSYPRSDVDDTTDPHNQPSTIGEAARRTSDTPEDCADSYRSSNSDSRSRDWTIDKVILVAMPAGTEYMAVAKAAAKLTRRTPGLNAEQLPDRFQPYRFVYDFDSAPASTLTDSWGALPAVANASGSPKGERLLETAIEKTWGDDQTTVDPADSHLYGPDGSPLTDRESVEELQNRVDNDPDDLYLVSALHVQPDDSDSLEEQVAERTRERVSRASTRERLPCRSCGERRTHTFTTAESGFEGTDSEIEGQPIWDCQHCGASRYGPDPHDTVE